MTITEFLLARIAEDEAAANLASAERRWRSKVHRNNLTIETSRDDSMGWEFGGGSGVWDCNDPYDDCGQYVASAEFEAEHIVRFDPARMLAECKAKRAIIAAHQREAGFCGSCSTYIPFATLPESERTFPEYWPCPTIKALAEVHANHPDFDPEWRHAE